jgi:hypothetical protein
MEASGQLHAPAAFPPRERVPGTHWIGGRVGPQSRSGRGGEAKAVTALESTLTGGCRRDFICRRGALRHFRFSLRNHSPAMTEMCDNLTAILLIPMGMSYSPSCTPFALRALGGGVASPRLLLLPRIIIYSRQVISLALEAHYLGQLDSQYLYPFGSHGGPAIPPGTGCSF